MRLTSKTKSAGLVDDLPEEAEVHEPLFLFLQVLVRAHDAAEVADARRLDPEPDGQVGQAGSFPSIAREDLAQTPVIIESNFFMAY